MELKTEITPPIDLGSVLASGLESGGYKEYVGKISKYYKNPEEKTGRLLLDEIIQTNEDIKVVLGSDKILPDTPWPMFYKVIDSYVKDKYGVSDETAPRKKVNNWYALATKLNHQFAEACNIAFLESSQFVNNPTNFTKINNDLFSKSNMKNYDDKLPFYRNCTKFLDLLSGFVGQRQFDEEEQKYIDESNPSQFEMIDKIEFLRFDPGRIQDKQVIDIFNKISELPIT